MFARRLALPILALLAACTPPQVGSAPLKPVTNAEAFDGVQCSAVRPQTEPDLMAWDPGSRLNLKRLRAEGLVAVRYEAEGCNVKLELLSNCVGPGTYRYTPYSANEHKVAHDANELFAQLPVGAASLTGKVKGDKALRTDYTLVGQYALPPSASFKRSDLKGADCSRATHVVSAAYVGGFALVSGEGRELDAAATVFGAAGGAKQLASAERLADEGDADACKDAQKSQKANGACDVPLRVGLLALDAPTVSCPDESSWDGARCVQKQVAIECPAGTSLQTGKCVAQVSTSCSAGMHFVAGTGCVPDVVPAAVPAPAAPVPARVAPPTGVGGTCPSGMTWIEGGSFWMGSDDGDADEKPVHQVAVRGFCMDSTEVTVAHWGACVRSGSCPSAPTTVDWAGITDAQRKLGAACNGNRADRQNHPINCVDRNQATTFCGAYGKRLPTEEEWEYAAGGGSEHRKFPWGDEAPGPTLINACGSECVDWATSIGLNWSAMYTQSDGWETTAPVGSFPRGRTPQGLSDMAGNVWEWTSSNYAKSYNSNDFTDFRVNRGGGWADDDPSYLRAANRLRNAPTSRGYTLGFRCAR